MPFSRSNLEAMQYRRLSHPRASWFLSDDHKESHVNKNKKFPPYAQGRKLISCLRIRFTSHQGVASGHLSVKSKSFQPQESVDHVSSSPPIELGPSAPHFPHALPPTHHSHVHSRKRTTRTWMRVHSLSFPTYFHTEHQVSYPNWRFLLACLLIQHSVLQIFLFSHILKDE